MKKTIITTLAISAISFAFAQSQEATQVEAPKIGTQQINSLKANMMRGQVVGTAQAMPAMQGGNIMEFMTTGDKATDEKLKVLTKEMNEKMKAIQEEYQSKIKALIGERKLMPKTQNSGTAERKDVRPLQQGMMQGKEVREGQPVMMKNMEDSRGEMRAEIRQENRQEGRLNMMETKEVDAPNNPFSRIQGMFKGVFNKQEVR